jgi:hypothetical protein
MADFSLIFKDFKKQNLSYPMHRFGRMKEGLCLFINPMDGEDME